MNLLTDQIRAQVGREAVYTAPDELGRAAIRYFARAVGDDNPVYTSDEAARAAGHDGVVAPPTLVCETNQYVERPRDDDGYAGHSWGLDVPGTRLVRGGNAYTFHRHVRPADVITATWRIGDVTERANRSGRPMLVVTSTAAYTDQAGDLLAENEETLVYVALGRAPSSDSPQVTSLPESESSAGSRTAARDEVAPLERTIALPDMVAYAGATWDWHRLHYDTDYLADRGLARPVVDGQVFGALLAEQLQDRLGPRAFIRQLHFRFRNAVFAGETVRCTARVSEVSGNLLTVESTVEVVGADARVAVAPAGATVELR